MTSPASNQPPGVNATGPAWTRTSKSSPKKTRTPYSAGAASSTSSISLLNPQASTSSLNLSQNQNQNQNQNSQNEAPFLTHRQRYHGKLTLVAPDNLGARRQAGTVDAPETRIDARGGFGLPGIEGTEGDEDGFGGGQEEDERAKKIKKKVKKKKRKEEEQLRQREIMAAVSNAGRTPSPGSNDPASIEILTSERETAHLAETTALQRTDPSPLAPADPPRRTAANQTARAPSTVNASHRRSLSPTYLPPPLDDPMLESQVSLGLVDPSILLSPPPPAYVPPPSNSTLPNEPPPPISVPSAALSIPRAVSGPSTVDSEEDDDDEGEDDSGPPDPLVLAWEADRLTGLYSLDERIARDMERRRAAEDSIVAAQGTITNGSAEELSTGEEDDRGGELTSASQGEDDLNEIRQAEASRDSRRLSRALSRHASRRYGAGSRRSTLLMGASAVLSPLSEGRTLEGTSETQSHSHSPSPNPSPSPIPSPSEISSYPLPSVVEPVAAPPLSPLPNSMPRLPRLSSNSTSRDLPVIGDTSTTWSPPPLMSPEESSAIAAEFPSPSPSQASPPLSNSPDISDTDDDRADPVASSFHTPKQGSVQAEEDEPRDRVQNEEEEKEEEEEENLEQALARRVTSNGRGLAALAAERRLRMEREERERREKSRAIEPVQEEEEEEEVGEAHHEIKHEGKQRPQRELAASDPVHKDTVITAASPLPNLTPATATLRRQPSLPDHELSFSQPSSRSSHPRPAPAPQLVPLEPEPKLSASQASASSSTPMTRPVPPPVPIRRSVGRRSLEMTAPASSIPQASLQTSNLRRVPPPPPPPREIAHRSSVRAIAAALDQVLPTAPLARPASPSLSNRSMTVSTTREESVETASTGSASTFPPSTLTGPRPIPLQPRLDPAPSLMGSPNASTPQPSSLNGTSAPAPRRNRPLPVPPAPLSQDRIDAFTALRAVHGILSPTDHNTSRIASSETITTSPASVPRRPSLHPRLSTSSSSSSFENPGPPLPRRPPIQPQSQELSAYTDLDLLLARLEGDTAGSESIVEGANRLETEGETETRADDGRNYDDLLTLGEIMGNVAPAGASTEEIAEHLTVARVELERRRIDKRGKVKTKLSVVGVRCVDCSICMSRFRVDDFAVVLSNCLHIFHEKCIRTWFRQSRQCPVCRAQVFPPRPLVDLTSP
ncbi:hypothetical protein JCM5350_007937 [Sporobolomyces pararoseus]